MAYRSRFYKHTKARLLREEAARAKVGTFATTTITLTQSTALAYSQKKKDNGKDGNDNGNTITIQKCKQAATQSGFDNNQGQECENLICTHPGENATCTQEGVVVVTPTPTPTPQPVTGTLLVRKLCVTFQGFGCDPNFHFPIVVTGNNNPQPVYNCKTHKEHPKAIKHILGS